MGEEIAFENGRISDFQGLMTLTLTLTLYRVILHTVMPHSSTSTYTPNIIEIEETFCGQTDVWTGGRTFETHFIRSTRRSRPNKTKWRKRRRVQYLSAGSLVPINMHINMHMANENTTGKDLISCYSADMIQSQCKDFISELHCRTLQQTCTYHVKNMQQLSLLPSVA